MAALLTTSLYRPLLPQLALMGHSEAAVGRTPKSPNYFQRGSGPGVHAPQLPDIRRPNLAKLFATDPVATKRGGLPEPRYASFQEFLADAINHDWYGEGTLVVLTRHGESIFNKLSPVIYGSMESPLVAEGHEQAKRAGTLLKGIPFRAVYASTQSRARQTADDMREAIGFSAPAKITPDLIEISHGLLDSMPRDMTEGEFVALLDRLDTDVQERAAFGKLYGLTEDEVRFASARCRERLATVRHYCAQNGLTVDEAIAATEARRQDIDYAAPIDGESFQGMKLNRAPRVKALLESIESAPGAVLFVAHGMFNKVMMMEFFGVDLENRKQLKQIGQDNCALNVLWRKSGESTWQLLVLNGEADGNP